MAKKLREIRLRDELTAEFLGIPIPNVSNFYTKEQVDGLIPTVPTDISDLTDNEGLLNQNNSGGLTQAQALTLRLL